MSHAPTQLYNAPIESDVIDRIPVRVHLAGQKTWNENIFLLWHVFLVKSDFYHLIKGKLLLMYTYT